MTGQLRHHLIAADRHGLGLVHQLETLARVDPEHQIQWIQAAMLARRVRASVVAQLAADKTRGVRESR